MCQPVYFVSRAQTVIKIQSDIINTRKGQDCAGCGIKHTQPCWGWHPVNSKLSAGTQCRGKRVGGLDQAQALGTPATEWRFTRLCFFCWRRRNAIFSVVVLLDSLVKLACGYFVTSLQIFIEREGEWKAEVLMFAEFVFSAGLPMIQGTSPSAQVHRPQSNGASHVTWPPSGGGGDFVPGQQNFKACIFFPPGYTS